MDSSKLDDGVKVLELADAIQQAIIAQSTPKDRNDAPSGAYGVYIAYDTELVLNALCWSMANFIVQSGDFPSVRERKRAVDKMAKRIMTYCPKVEQMMEVLGPTVPPNDNR